MLLKFPDNHTFKNLEAMCVHTDAFIGQASERKGPEVKTDMEQVASTLHQNSQALWVTPHRALAHKLD